MSTTTTNYGLIKPDTTDPILIGQLNDNADAIDAALKENADAIGNKLDAADIPTPSTAAPAMDGTGSAGTSSQYARADHVHPSDTSKQNALTTAQLDAVNSGIDSTKVAQIETNKNNILSVASRQHIIVSPTRSSKSILAISATGAFTSDMRGSILISMGYQTDSFSPSLVLVNFNDAGFGSLFTWLAGSGADGGTITAIQRSGDYKTLYLTVRGSSFTAPMLIPLMDAYPEFGWQWLDSIPT
jgi:hypothetical protein